jgi:uncharacterized membrane protein YagU involved in acid resistance
LLLLCSLISCLGLSRDIKPVALLTSGPSVTALLCLAVVALVLVVAVVVIVVTAVLSRVTLGPGDLQPCFSQFLDLDAILFCCSS